MSTRGLARVGVLRDHLALQRAFSRRTERMEVGAENPMDPTPASAHRQLTIRRRLAPEPQLREALPEASSAPRPTASS